MRQSALESEKSNNQESTVPAASSTAGDIAASSSDDRSSVTSEIRLSEVDTRDLSEEMDDDQMLQLALAMSLADTESSVN